MKYLLNYGFCEDDISYLKDFYEESIIEDFISNKDEIISKLKYIMSFGVLNINEVICANALLVFYEKERLKEMFSREDITNILLNDPYID